MGFKLGTMMKLLKGGLGPDDIAEVLSAAGIEAEFHPIEKNLRMAAFEEIATCSALPAACTILLKARMKSGETLNGILVVQQGSGTALSGGS